MDDYGRRIILDVPFDQALARTSVALHHEGFDVVAIVDVRDYLAQNAHHECRRYVLLEALLPQVTLDALQHDSGTGPMLPTTIAIYELPDGETAVAATRRSHQSPLTSAGGQDDLPSPRLPTAPPNGWLARSLDYRSANTIRLR